MSISGSPLVEPFGTVHISHDITEMGRALLRMRGKKTRGKPIYKATDVVRAGFPELEQALQAHLKDRGGVTLGFDGKDKRLFARRPFAINLSPSPDFEMPDTFKEWILEALLGASQELKAIGVHPKTHLSGLDRCAHAHALIQRTKEGEGWNQAVFHLQNYRPDCTEMKGFHYTHGFTIAVRFPHVGLMAGSQNGSGVEARVIVDSFDLHGLVDRENLDPIRDLTRAIRHHLFPQAGMGMHRHPIQDGSPHLQIIKPRNR